MLLKNDRKQSDVWPVFEPHCKQSPTESEFLLSPAFFDKLYEQTKEKRVIKSECFRGEFSSIESCIKFPLIVLFSGKYFIRKDNPTSYLQPQWDNDVVI